jgi:hypothetical protein
MSTTVRDRTARSRIREYLAEHGPIVDPSGRATAVLKDAVGYEGSPVAFIQLVTAMDKSSEIEREIRGKRTYRISGLGSGTSAGTSPRAHTATAHPGSSSSARAGAGTHLEVDYDELARALLRETWRLAELADAQATSAEDSRELEIARAERDQLIAERDEYARRLQQLSAMINGLAPTAAGSSDSTDSESRRLLAELAREQGSERREREQGSDRRERAS